MVFVVCWIVECYQYVFYCGLKGKILVQVWQESVWLIFIYMFVDFDQFFVVFMNIIMWLIMNSGVIFDYLFYNFSVLQLLCYGIFDDEKVKVWYFNEQIGYVYVYDL